MSVTAARELVDQTCARFRVPLYILHDFDVTGFSIATTLHQSNRRYRFRTVSGEDFKVVDFGLRLDDVERLGLASEPVSFGKSGKDALSDRLEINGAAKDEIEFLLSGRRVELNAMTSGQFIDLLEAKLAEHSVGKVIPGADELEDAYRLFARGARAKLIAEGALAAMSKEKTTAPTDLVKRVRAYLAKHPESAWDEAVSTLVTASSGPSGRLAARKGSPR
jgi:hypothetical protein